MLKNILVTGVASVALIASAAALAGQPDHQTKNNGFFAKAQLGYGFTRAKDSGIPAKDRNGFAARLAGGYMYNQYVGLEAGLERHPELKFYGSTVKVYSLDLMAKGVLPFYHNMFFAYGEAGLAYTHETAKGSMIDGTEKADFYRPKAEVGVGYNVNTNVAVTTSYSRIFKKADLSMPNLDTAAVGVTYRF